MWGVRCRVFLPRWNFDRLATECGSRTVGFVQVTALASALRLRVLRHNAFHQSHFFGTVLVLVLVFEWVFGYSGERRCWLTCNERCRVKGWPLPLLRRRLTGF